MPLYHLRESERTESHVSQEFRCVASIENVFKNDQQFKGTTIAIKPYPTPNLAVYK